MKSHPYADCFPMMTDAELQELADDIKANGQREAVWIDQDGLVLDGRNRVAACKLAKMEPKTRQHRGSDESKLALVTSANIHRRHMTAAQKGFAAAKLANLENGSNRFAKKVGVSTETPTKVKPVSREKALQITGASKSSMARARRVTEQGSPKLIAATQSEAVALHAAEEIIARHGDDFESQDAEVATARQRTRKKRSGNKADRVVPKTKRVRDKRRPRSLRSDDGWVCPKDPNDALQEMEKLIAECEGVFQNVNSYSANHFFFVRLCRRLAVIARYVRAANS